MKKSDLRTGDIVLTRDEDIYIVLKGTRAFGATGNLIVSLKSGNYMKLDYYNDDLKEKDGSSRLDIVKVCSHGYVGDTIREHIIRKTNNWTWERQEVKEMTVDEISKALGYEVKVVGEDR